MFRVFAARVLVVASVAVASLASATPRSSAANGCTPTNPVAAPGVTDTCDYVITPGGDYNASVAAQSLTVDVFAKNGSKFRHLDIAGPARETVITAEEATKLAGGKIKATVTNGFAVVGCAACDMPAS